MIMPTAVFPDWSPYPDLDSAARAYLRDPEVALDALDEVLAGSEVLGFTLERFVNEHNGVWQEVAVCDGSRLLLWHGEDVPPGEGPPGSMVSSLRVVPVSAITEVGYRKRLTRSGDGRLAPDSVDVYVLLSSLDDGGSGDRSVRQDALRFGKTLIDGGPGQMGRLEKFAQLMASLSGRPLV